VTRSPSTNSGFALPSRSSASEISGPPPCTTTGARPHAFSSSTSAQNERFSASLVIAAPPYLITQRVPRKRAM
jgi:hypothetical protein